MALYKEIGIGWPENQISSQKPTKSEVKRLVNIGHWHRLGQLFDFTPVYHFSSLQWIDWRCVPQSLIDILQSPKHPNSPPTARVISKRVHVVKNLNARGRSPITAEQEINIKRVRLKLYEMQNGVCHYCKQRFEWAQFSVDHKLPLSRGGSRASGNEIGCCKNCNNFKGCLTEEEFFALEPHISGIEKRAKAFFASKKKWVFSHWRTKAKCFTIDDSL